jgi:drug/metabolite transporter (DMT)-like permease
VLIGYAGLGAVVAAAAGAVVVRVSRRRGISMQLTVAVGTAVGSVALGALVAADRMFISEHDLQALAVVLVAAGSVGFCVALVIGSRVSASTRALAMFAQEVGAGRPHLH